MLRKKLLLLLMLVTLLASLASPGGARACSGDDCGCYIYAEECRYDCQQEEPAAYYACVRGCNRANLQCAKACCGGY